jgi:hypothetical protein
MLLIWLALPYGETEHGADFRPQKTGDVLRKSRRGMMEDRPSVRRPDRKKLPEAWSVANVGLLARSATAWS